MAGADGRDIIAGIVAGYEVQIRLSIALDPSEHYLRGFHPTATCGAFGAAAAAARVFGLSADDVANAFGLAASQAAGSMQFLLDGAWNKPFHTGYAAMSGLRTSPSTPATPP
jgi:2-methylcitrate dehydratase PrpD